MATWPAAFCPLAGSFQESPPNNVIRTNMDRGPDKVRRRTTANVRPLTFKLSLTPAQVNELDDFYNNETYGGADEFDYTHPRTGAPYKARFVSPPSYQDRGRRYEASIQLELMP